MIYRKKTKEGLQRPPLSGTELRGTSQDGDRYSSLTEDTLPETKINVRLGVYR